MYLVPLALLLQVFRHSARLGPAPRQGCTEQGSRPLQLRHYPPVRYPALVGLGCRGLRGFDPRTRSRMGGSPSFLCFSLCFSLLYLCSSLLLSRSSLLLPCLTPHTSHTLPVGLVGMLREVGGSPIRSWHLERRPPKGFGARSDSRLLRTGSVTKCTQTNKWNGMGNKTRLWKGGGWANKFASI